VYSTHVRRSVVATPDCPVWISRDFESSVGLSCMYPIKGNFFVKYMHMTYSLGCVDIGIRMPGNLWSVYFDFMRYL
jgi:hypothetical protein